MKRNQFLISTIAALSIVSMQFYSSLAYAAPSSTCVRLASNAAKGLWVVLKPGVQLAVLGEGFHYMCKRNSGFFKGTDYVINGQVVGQSISGSVVIKSKDCGCEN